MAWLRKAEALLTHVKVNKRNPYQKKRKTQTYENRIQVLSSPSEENDRSLTETLDVSWGPNNVTSGWKRQDPNKDKLLKQNNTDFLYYNNNNNYEGLPEKEIQIECVSGNWSESRWATLVVSVDGTAGKVSHQDSK